MLQSIFRIIGSAYPASFKQEFYEEIMADLSDRDAELRQMNFAQRFMLLKREVSGWISSIAHEQISEIKTKSSEFLKRGFSLFNELEVSVNKKKEKSGVWQIKDSKEALIASLPPFIFGSAVWVTWLIIGGPWYTASDAQLKAGLLAGLLLAAVIAVGGIIALIKRFPVWGYTWLGMDVLGFLLCIKSLAEESPNLIPEWLTLIIAVSALIFCAVVLVHAVLESWQAAGLFSTGMSTAMALANVHTMAIGPYHRVDLAILGLVCGLILSALTYAYLRTTPWPQAGLLGSIGLLNLGILYLANQVWSQHLAEVGKTSPLLPMLVILLILLLVGPFAGLFRKPVKSIFGKFIKG